MMTISQIEVEPGGDSAPTLYDIGYALSKASRFAGHTKTPYTVLQHLYAALHLAQAYSYDHLIQLHALLHDAHEAVIQDIPSTWKTDDMRDRQHELDKRIYASLAIELPTPGAYALVKHIDQELLAAEKLLVGPKADRVYANQQIENPAMKAVRFSLWFIPTMHLGMDPSHHGKTFENSAKELIARVRYNAIAA